MSLHHVALGTTRVAEQAAFYARIPGVSLVAEHPGPDGTLRSVWLRFGATIIMIERSQKVEAPRALVFPLPNATEPAETTEALRLFLAGRVADRTEFTLYLKDEDGNRVGFSSYPEPLIRSGWQD